MPVGGLRDVLARALGDLSLELAFAAPSGTASSTQPASRSSCRSATRSRTVIRLEREDELLGVLVHDPAIEAEDPGLVEAVGNAARLALENERLAAEVRAQLEEVRASRARIVEAADAERRRGAGPPRRAQQRLVALALRLQVAKETTPGATALLDEATGELQTAIGEVRGLARGVHPTILTETGLRARSTPGRADPAAGHGRHPGETLRPAARGDRLLRRRRGPHERRPLRRRERGPRRGGRARRPARGDRHRRRPRRRRPGGAGSGLGACPTGWPRSTEG